MNKLTLHILTLGCLLSLSACNQETTTPPTASPTPQVSSTVSVDSTASGSTSGTGVVAGSGGGGSSGGSSSSSQGTGDSTVRPAKTSGVKTTPKPPNVTPSEWRKKNFKPRPFKDFAKLPGYSVVRVLTPQPPTSTTLREGKKMYENSCVFCHGADGTPPNRDAALVRYNMADLSQPHQYKFGSGEKALFRSIAYGVDVPVMPPLENVYTKQQIWDLVNYIRTLQK